MTIIVSNEIIRPSCPTPSHLKTYNLSLLDQISMDEFLPMVMFYPNTGISRSSRDDITIDLKKSLSQTLAKYFPFAGRLAKTAPAYVDCNDGGAEFFEASIDSTLLDFLQKSQHEDFDQLFPYERVWYESNHKGDQSDEMIPLAVQANHFKCGGVAVAASLSHKISDGTSLIHFLNDWGTTTRFCLKGQIDESPIQPEFASYPSVNLNFDGFSLDGPKDCVTRSFVFPNSKINDLKLKVIAMASESGRPITNPTRVEVLNWLLYKSAVAAATLSTTNPGFSKQTTAGHVINIRDKMMEQVSKRRIENLYMIMKIYTNNEDDMKPEGFINELQKQKMKFRALKNVEEAFGLVNLSSEVVKADQEFIDNAYICTSLCRYPTYEIDFGWGKPLKTTFGGNLRKNTFLLLDAPDGDGIEALVCLGKQDMDIIQNDPDLLAFC